MRVHKNETPFCPRTHNQNPHKIELCVLTHNQNPHGTEKTTDLVDQSGRCVAAGLGSNISKLVWASQFVPDS